jgi:DNA-binding transcriptional MerR regulator
MPFVDPAKRLAMIREMRESGATYQQIASACDPPVSRERIRQICADHGITPPRVVKPCATCGAEIEVVTNYARRTTNVYCSDPCRVEMKRRRTEAQHRAQGVRPIEEWRKQWDTDRQALIDRVKPLHDEGYTYAQIGEMLGLNPDSLHVFMARHAPLGKPYRTWRKERGFPVPNNRWINYERKEEA